MATELTDPDGDGILEFTQTIEDVDGDPISTTLELDEINGTTQSGSDRTPGWLSYTASSSISGGTRNVDVDVQINASELEGAGTTYTFELYADDGVATSTCRFTLDVRAATTERTGDRLYLGADTSDASVFQYNLSIPYDESSIGTKEKTASIQGDGGVEIKFDDGTKFYTIDADVLKEYDLSTAWDVTTFSKVQDVDLSSQIVDPRGLKFAGNGEYLYIIDYDDGTILQYALSTPWDISSLSLDVTYNISSDVGNRAAGMDFKRDGKKLFISTNVEDMWTYNLGTKWDIDTRSNKQKEKDSFASNLGFLSISDDGKKMLIGTEIDQEFEEFSFGTAWDASTLSFEGEVNAQENEIHYDIAMGQQ